MNCNHLFIALTLFCFTAVAQNNKQQTLDINKPGDHQTCKLLLLLNEKDQILSSGAGFIAKYKGHYFLITNYHVLTHKDPIDGHYVTRFPTDPVKVKISNGQKNKFGKFNGLTESIFNEDGQRYYTTTLKDPTQGSIQTIDIVALPISDTSEIAAHHPINFTQWESPDLIDDNTVIAYGYPLIGEGNPVLSKEGLRLNYRTLLQYTIPPLMAKTAIFPLRGAIGDGYSGCPIFFYPMKNHLNSEGELIDYPDGGWLIGIHSRTDLDDNKIAVSTFALQKLLDEALAE